MLRTRARYAPGPSGKAGMRWAAAWALGLAALAAPVGCARDTSALTPEWRGRFETEGIVRRADNVVVRHTRLAGPYDKGYKDRLASIIVTRGTILIHQNERVLLEVTPRTRRLIEIKRQGSRVRIRAVGQRVAETLSFEPKEDAAGWAAEMRKVVKLAEGPSG